MASISIVLKAVDQYSGVITGLNQGFELVGKSIDIMKAAADIAFAAMAKGVELVGKTIDLAALGGNFEEQRSQFENLANSYGKTGQKIIDTVKSVSSNTISELEALPVATKAIASRLQGPDLENVLTYAKKWSEAYGGSYESAAEAMFNAFSTGKYVVLKQMGLVIEKGTTTDGVLNLISEGLKRFGETGFNTGDKLAALNASVDDFWTKIGRAINATDVFDEGLGTFSDSFVDFIKGIDATPVTQGMDAIFAATKRMYNAIADAGITKAFAEICLSIIVDIQSVFNSIGKGTVKTVTMVRDAVSTIGAVMRDNPSLGIGAGTYLDAENLAKAEVVLNKFAKETQETWAKLNDDLEKPGKQISLALAQSLSTAEKFRFSLNKVPDDMNKIVDTAKKIPDELQRLYDLQDSRAAAGLDVRTGKPIAGTENTALEKAVAGKDSSIASLLNTSLPMESILQALGKFLLDTVMGTASAEKMQLTTITTAI